jgi:hypothetical protein
VNVIRGRSGKSRGPTSAAPPNGSSGDPVVHSITGAVQAHSDDMDVRIKRYLISMGIRTVCVVLVLVIHNPVRWVFAVLAVLLPYIAVVMANAAGNRRGRNASPVTPPLVQPISLTGSDPNVVSDPKPETPTSPSAEQSTEESHEWTS